MLIDSIMQHDKTTVISLWILLAALASIVIYVLFQAFSYTRKLTYCTNLTKARVVDKKHVIESSYMAASPIGKVFIPKTHKTKEKYYVSLRVDNEVRTINNRSLYCRAEVGDCVDVIVHDGYNRRGLLKTSYITLAAH